MPKCVPCYMRNNNEGKFGKKKHGEDVGLDSEDEAELYIDSSDEERLKSMSEKQRQKILYERHAKLSAYKEQKEIDVRLGELERSRAPSIAPKKEVKEALRLTINDLSACILTRDFILCHVEKPFFDKFVGQLVKAKIRDSYHVSWIESIGTGDTYTTYVDKNEVTTNKTFDLVVGKDKFRQMGIQFVSNSALTNDEFAAFRSENEGFDVKEQEAKLRLLKKQNQQSGELVREDSVVKQKVPERKKNTMLKIDLIKRRERALEMKRYDQAEAIQEQINSLSTNEKGDKDVWAVISERNRKINTEAARLKSEKYGQSAKEDGHGDPCKRKKTRNNYE